MNLKKSVSVIIPNYNNAQWVEKCIQSCLDQGDYLKEIIFVDDHSTDKSIEIVMGMATKNGTLIQIFTNPEKGANAARNFGFSKSTGDFIQWLDSDDQILPNKFENQLKGFDNSEIDIVYSDWRMDFYENLELIKSEVKKHHEFSDFLYQLLIDNWTSPNNYLISRKIAVKLDHGLGWNPATRIGQDREYFTMAGILGANFKYIPGEFCIYNRWSSLTISGMDFSERLVENQTLERMFRDWITSKIKNTEKKSAYLKILNTHMIKARYYHRGINFDRFIFPWDVNWKIIHWKMRFVIPIIIVIGNFKYLLLFKHV